MSTPAITRFASGKSSNATAKLKARCEFLGINHQAMNNRERKKALKVATGGKNWPEFLATRDQNPKLDGSVEFRHTFRKVKGQEKDRRKANDRKIKQNRAELNRQKREKDKIDTMDKQLQILTKRAENAKKALDKHIKFMADYDSKKAAYDAGGKAA